MMVSLNRYNFGGVFSLYNLAAIFTIVIFVVGLVVDISKNTSDIFEILTDVFIIIVVGSFLSVINREYKLDNGELIVSRFGKIKIIINIEHINKMYSRSPGTVFLIAEKESVILYLERAFSPEQFDLFIKNISVQVQMSNCSRLQFARFCFRALFL